MANDRATRWVFMHICADQSDDNYVKTYNHLIPQRPLKHLSTVQALKEWQAQKPELFKKHVNNQPGLDS